MENHNAAPADGEHQDEVLDVLPGEADEYPIPSQRLIKAWFTLPLPNVLNLFELKC